MKETRVQFLGWEGPQEKEMMTKVGFPGGSDGKESDSNAEDLGSIPGLGRSPGEGNGNPLPYSCLENPTTEEPARLHTVHGIAKSRTQLSDLQAHTHTQ